MQIAVDGEGAVLHAHDGQETYLANSTARVRSAKMSKLANKGRSSHATALAPLQGLHSVSSILVRCRLLPTMLGHTAC